MARKSVNVPRCFREPRLTIAVHGEKIRERTADVDAYTQHV